MFKPRWVPICVALALLVSGCAKSLKSYNESDLLTQLPINPQIAADELSKTCSANIQSAQQQLAGLEALPPPYSVDSLLKPLDKLFLELDNTISMVVLLNNVHPDQSVREAAEPCVQNFSKLYTEIGLSDALYQRVSQVNAASHDDATQRYLKHMLRDFRRSGVDKNKDTRAKIKVLNEEIVKLGQEFSRNIREDVREIKLKDASLLLGLPADYIAAHPQNAEGEITITTNYPDVFPLLRYAENDTVRLDIYKKFLDRAYPANRDLLLKIIQKRHELATLLSYDNYAEYATEVMMVKSPESAANFIDRIADMLKSRAVEDYDELLQVLRKIDPKAKEVGNWQKSYLEEIVKKEKYDYDAKLVRQYFQYDNVKRGIFDLVQALFGVEIRTWDTPVWHESVEPFEIVENGNVIGRFFLDMHPRAGKYKHAAQFSVKTGIADTQLPVAALVCNFPGGDESKGLMEHRQVETFLHEFGHLLHSIFGGHQQWAGQSGVATERDFVEAPSQMLEEWIWDYDTLSSFATNAEGEVIPKTLVDKMTRARSFGRGTHIRNQMFYAALSLNYYRTAPSEIDLDKMLVELQQKYSPFNYIEDTHFYANFGHLYGYSAAYYTYMWSEVIAADILSKFKKEGMRNRDVAMKYRKSVLEPGGSKDAADLVESFLGRPFNFEAFVRELNSQ